MVDQPGYSTLSRNMSKALSYDEIYPDGHVEHHDNLAIQVADQTTTSFRTGGTVSESEFRQSSQSIFVNGLTKGAPSLYDKGHEFFTRKRKEVYSHNLVTLRTLFSSGAWYNSYRGPLILTPESGSDWGYPVVEKMSQNDINFYGATAIANTYPTKPQANLSLFIGEILIPQGGRGLPNFFGELSLLSGRANTVRFAGDRFLNIEFGWLPLLSDITKLMKAVQRSYKIMKQYERDSGLVVRRRYDFEPRVFTSQSKDLFNQASFLHSQKSWFDDGSPVKGNVTLNSTRTERTWFSGAYSYYLDPGKDFLGKLVRYENLANEVLGTRLTPNTLWQLAPWTWLVDWFADLGSILTNAEAFSSANTNNLVLRYGYLMRETHAEDIYTLPEVQFKLNSVKTPFRAFQVVQKERYRATPYGFGLDPDLFSPSQWAILGALGMTKGYKHLR